MKAVLVINMPTSCEDCPCYDQEVGTCRASDTWKTNIKNNCPLRPLPRRMSMRDEAEFYLGYMNGKTKYLGFNEGYNACLEDILGEE